MRLWTGDESVSQQGSRISQGSPCPNIRGEPAARSCPNICPQHTSHHTLLPAVDIILRQSTALTPAVPLLKLQTCKIRNRNIEFVLNRVV